MEKKLLACFVGIPVILMVLLAFFLMYQSYEKGSSKEAYTISLTQDAIHFNGMVDHVVNFTDIKNIEYKEEAFEGKKSGAGEGTSTFLAGDAKDKELGKCKAYVYYDKPYYIIIYTENDTFVFNLPKKQECENIYKQLNRYLNKNE